MKKQSEIHKYWKEEHEIDYTGKKYNDRSLMLLQEVKKLFLPAPKKFILEIGCNAGRNLNTLFKSGYKNMTGLDISWNAIGKMSNKYPNLFIEVDKIVGAIEDSDIQYVLDKRARYMLVFTMGVLMHIHPKEIFKIVSQMCNYSKKYIMIFELTKRRIKKQPYAWTHDYKELFHDTMKVKFLKYINVSKSISPDYQGMLFMKDKSIMENL